MPNVIPQARYYPRLSEIVTANDLPDSLAFVQDGLANVLDKVHYKNFQYSKSNRGDSAFYSLDIVSSKKLQLALPFGISMMLNPDFSGGDSNISSFPVRLEYQWEILAFLKSFNLEGFSFAPEAFYELGLKLFRMTDEQVLSHMFSVFVEPPSPTGSRYSKAIDDINQYFGFSAASGNLLQLPAGTTPSISSLTSAIRQHPGINTSVPKLLFSVYILGGDVNATKEKLQLFFRLMVPEGIETYVRKIIIPKAKAAFELSAALEFPRNILQPVYDQSGHNPYNTTTGTPFTVIPPDANGFPKAQLKFAEAEFYADTEQGLGYSMDIALGLATPVQIGNTPLVMFIDQLKLDLSKKQNPSEITLDGRPAEFTGVYVREALIAFPASWNHDVGASTAVIKGRNMIIGTGGVSGTVSLEGVQQGSNSAALFKLGDLSSASKNFGLSLNRFSIEFKQGSIVQSDIAGSMKIPGFQDALGNDAQIDVTAHIGNNDDFRITASEADGFQTLRIPDVFDLNLRSISVGRERNKWYVEASATLLITATIPHVTADFLKAPIDIKKIRIYQDGSLEFMGGGITLPYNVQINVGPVALNMDQISFGSHESLHGTGLRQYFYFGFNGTLKTGGGSVEVRGDGVEFHFTRDGGPLHTYLRIAGVGVDIKIPGNASKESADLFIHGYLGMRHGSDAQGNPVAAGPEYQGSVSLDIRKLKIHGKAAMRMMPKVPAWIVDAELELGTPLALGATGLGIYGFRGLVGNHFVASKSKAGVSEEASWYDYLKAPQQGVNINKFDPTKDGFSMGIGASIATMGDDGWAFSSKVFVMLSMPEMFLIEGKANVLAKRLGINNENDPPFYAFLVVDNHSIQAGLGVNYKVPSGGEILSLRGEMQMGFFFGNSSAWYLNVGRDLPEDKRIQARLFTLFNAYAYLMVSSQGIKAGAGAKFELQKKFGPVRVGLNAYIDTKGFISFKPVQIGGAIQLGGGVYIKVGRFGIEINVAAGLSAEAPMPFVIAGFIQIKIKIFIFKIKIKLEFTWIIRKRVDTNEVKLIDPTEFSDLPASEVAQHPFKAINMMSGEAFTLKYLSNSPYNSNPDTDPSWNNHIIPMDSYIDIEFKRPVKPWLARYGGGVSPLPQFTEYVSPQRSRMPQVKHSFIVEGVDIKIWNKTHQRWDTYDPWAALTRAFQTAGLNVNTESYPFGYWQYNNNPGKYTSLRLLAQTPFAVSNGTPPESFGLLSKHLLCEGKPEKRYHQYWNYYRNSYVPSVYPAGTALRDGELVLRFGHKDGSIGAIPNVFGTEPSLKIGSSDTLEVFFKEPAAEVTLRLTSLTGVRVRFYQKQFTGTETLSGLPDYEYVQVAQTDYNCQDLLQDVQYTNGNLPISKITIETLECSGGVEELFNVYWQWVNEAWASGQYGELTDWQLNQINTWLLQFGPANGELSILVVETLYGTWKSLWEEWGLNGDETNHVLNWMSYAGGAVDYGTVMNGLCTSWTDILANESLYPTLYPFVYEWHDKYCNGLFGDSLFDLCSTYLHEASWLTEKQWERNELLYQNNQTTITTGINTLAQAINEALPPIWRPDSAYAIMIQTRDEVNAGGATDVSDPTYPYPNTHVVGFKTGGPVGFFHQTQPAYQQLEQANKADQYKLANLLHYIDFSRSYPNANGKILGAKPLYYRNPKIGLYFNKPYVYEFFTKWDDYGDNGAKEYRLLSLIMDPLDKPSDPPAVPAEVMGWQVHKGQNAVPIDAFDIEVISNVLSQSDPLSPTNPNCTEVTLALKPPTVSAEVQRNYDLLPQKMYKAVFKAVEVKPAGNQESVVHAYAFETSRYSSFSAHIGSHVRTVTDPATGQQLNRKAVYPIQLEGNTTQLADLTAKLQGAMAGSLLNTDPLIAAYASVYDRMVTGVLKMEALQAVTGVEVNVIKMINTQTNTITLLGLLVKSPEPFNDPKLPLAVMDGTLTVTDPSNPQAQFKHVFAKDNASVFITNSALSLPLHTLNLAFTYKKYNGVTYTDAETATISVELNTI